MSLKRKDFISLYGQGQDVGKGKMSDFVYHTSNGGIVRIAVAFSGVNPDDGIDMITLTYFPKAMLGLSPYKKAHLEWPEDLSKRPEEAQSTSLGS